MSTFRSSRPAVLELATKYRELIEQLNDKSKPVDESVERALFSEMFEICLWGNATDLSLLTSLTYEDLQKLQGAEARKNAESNILLNDLPVAFETLQAARRDPAKKERRVDLVLDNAGFELFVDLILAGYLLSSGLATTVVMHPKNMSWFVSDVVPADFGHLFDALRDPQPFFTSTNDDGGALSGAKDATPLTEKEVEELQFLAQQWGTFHSEGNLIIRPSRFWTEGGSFWRLPHDAPELYEDLKASEVIILKGDLNYRKLTGDVCIPLFHLLFIIYTFVFWGEVMANQVFSYCRRTGTQPHHSTRQSVPLALDQISESLH